MSEQRQRCPCENCGQMSECRWSLTLKTWLCWPCLMAYILTMMRHNDGRV